MSLITAEIFTTASAIIGAVLLNRIRCVGHFQGCTFMARLASGLFTRWGAQTLGLLYLGKIGRRWLATVAAVFWGIIFFKLLLQKNVLLLKQCVACLQTFKLSDQTVNKGI